ncbi:MAG: hypothetical protein OXT67_00090 [Zetaproteobacteria bacterium]|nr:hypothetical protein [Zetaproteobacteria bacterium]
MSLPLTSESKLAEVSSYTENLDDLSAPVPQMILEQLAALECWSLFYTYLDAKLARESDPIGLDTFLLYLKARITYQRQPERTEYCLSRLIHSHHLSFADFRDKIAPHVIPARDYHTETVVLKILVKIFEHKSEQVLCLERLALLYAKRLHDDDEVEKINGQILKLDTHNLSALKFFKHLHSQRGEWEEACAYLQEMIAADDSEESRHRLVQELASTQLYQLDQPQIALDIVEKYGSHQWPGTDNLLYDAHAALGNWNQCLDILHEQLRHFDEHSKKAVVHYRIAEIHQILQADIKALEHLNAAIELNLNLYLAHTKKIDIFSKNQDWSNNLKAIEAFITLCEDPKSIRTLKELCSHIRERVGLAT